MHKKLKVHQVVAQEPQGYWARPPPPLGEVLQVLDAEADQGAREGQPDLKAGRNPSSQGIHTPAGL